MPLKRKRKTETENVEQTGADAGAEQTEQVAAQPVGASAPLSQGPSAWNLDAFAPYQAAGTPDAPSFDTPLIDAPLIETPEIDRTDVYPNGLLNGLGAHAPEEAEQAEPEKTDVFDRDQLPEKTDTFEAISQFDKTLYSDGPTQFEKTAGYDVSSSNGLTAHETAAPELEPLPSIFASFQEEKAQHSTPLFDDSISSQHQNVPSFDAAPIAPAPPPEIITPFLDAVEPAAPLFEAAPEMPHFANTTQRFTTADLGIAPPPDQGMTIGTPPSYTGAKTFGGSPLMEPEADRSSAFAGTGRLIVRLGRFSASYEVDRPEILIGRPDPESEIFPEVAIEWDDAISRRHARIMHRDDGDYVEDTGSTNGTKLNGVPLSPHDPQRLHSGDLVHVGSKTEIIYYE